MSVKVLCEHCLKEIDVYEALAIKLGLKETYIPNIWVDEKGNQYILTRLGFKLRERYL